jgi:putative aminopeptidase FrvX
LLPRSTPRWRRSAALAACTGALITLPAPRAAAQSESALTTWIGLDAPTGREAMAMQIVQQAQQGWTRDRLGDLTLTRGKGRPRRVIACAIDAPAFAVSEITDEGYLRLHAAGNWPPRSPLWDQF